MRQVGLQVNATEAKLSASDPLLEGAVPLCRDAQAQEMLELLGSHLSSRQGGSFYISGLPGTGLSPDSFRQQH